MGYDGVIFDFDGVLIDSGSDGFGWAHRAREERARELGHDIEGSKYQFVFMADTLKELKQMVDDSDLSWDEYREAEMAVSRRKAEMVKNGEMKLFSATEAVLEQLEVPASIVSNAYGDAVDEIVRYLGLDSNLESWTAPRIEELERYPQLMKPNTPMLEEAVEKMRASNPVMVGDSVVDVQAAENLGIESVLIDRYGFGDGAEPTHHISSLNELEAVISS
ncbi:MAG: HAD family hydrolase [Candidatus Nanohaloarchaea archaeon]